MALCHFYSFLPFLFLLWFHVYFHHMCVYVFFVLSFCRFPRWWWWCFVIWNLHNAQPLCKILLSLSHSYRIQMNRFVSTATRIIPWCDTWMELHNYAKKNEECTSTIATTTITTIASMMMIKNGLIFYVSAICIPVGYSISFSHKSTCFISLHALNVKNTRPICGQKHQRRNYSKRSIDCVYSGWRLSVSN